MQPVYWESEYLKEENGACYTCSQHYHYVTTPTDPRSANATRLVHSMVLEMLANASAVSVSRPSSSVRCRAIMSGRRKDPGRASGAGFDAGGDV